jgi:two-component system, NarL family, nitrate/nitrite response regulator NarL
VHGAAGLHPPRWRHAHNDVPDHRTSAETGSPRADFPITGPCATIESGVIPMEHAQSAGTPSHTPRRFPGPRRASAGSASGGDGNEAPGKAAGGGERQAGGPPAAHIRLLIVDRHTLFRLTTASIIAETSGFTVVGQATTGVQAVEFVRRLRPDIALIDLEGIEPAGETCRMLGTPPTKVVVFTLAQDEQSFLEAVRCGAVGYLPKTIDLPALERALRAVHRGETALPHRLMGRLLLRAASRPDRLMQVAANLHLTRREREVAALLTEGLTNKEIGSRLGITENTVRTHLQQLFHKLNVDNRTQVALLLLSEHPESREKESRENSQ